MGRHSGFIALNTGIGSGASSILIPETHTTVEDLVSRIKKGFKRRKLFSLIIVAEGNQNGGANELAEKIQKIMPQNDIKVTIIGHLQRGGSPTCMDRVLASRLGFAAVEGLLEGKADVMAVVISNKIHYTPFEEASKKEKKPKDDLIKMAEILAL